MKKRAEIELMDCFRKGDHRAFAKVFDTFYRELCYFARNMIGDSAQAEDIVSDAMSVLWRRHGLFESLQNVKAFLYISVRNQCLNYLRSFKYRNQVNGEILKLEEAYSDDYLLAAVIKVDLMNQVYQEIQSLPEQQKAVFSAYYFDNLSIDQIAEKMNITPSTVRGNKYQAIEKLKIRFFAEKGLVAFLLMVPGLLAG